MAVILANQKTIAQLLRDLQDPKRTLKKIGALLVAQGQRAFKEQRFGSYKWKPRYTGAPEPYVNVAGLIQDLNKGSAPKKRRFIDRTPALRDTGLLMKSLTNKTTSLQFGKYAVEYGTNVKYAPVHQRGGVTRMPITQGAKKALAKFLKRAANKRYRTRLGWIFQRDVLRTKVWARPFVGITPELRGKVGIVVAEDLASGGRAASSS